MTTMLAPAAFLLAIGTTVPAAQAQTETPAGDSPRDGILVMAHGAGPEWNAAIDAAIQPLRRTWPVRVAFGMADSTRMQAAVDSLEADGVERIAVVRLFVSGASFLEPTMELLGLAPAPDAMATHAMAPGDELRHGAEFLLSREGLAESVEAGTILADRVHDLSRDPTKESVLLLAHGMGEEAANDSLHEALNRIAGRIRDSGSFRRVAVETLREDWEGPRAEAEERIREFARTAMEDGGMAIVVPVRVYGFGPYGKVLDGLPYLHDGRGFLPHPLITDWIRGQATKLFSPTL